MHNSEKLMAGDRVHRARIHPDDAAAAGVADGDRVRIASAHGEIETEARITDEVIAGTVAVPHGWGHHGGWETANAAGGANVNLLMSSRPDDLERLAGMAHLNGVAVRVEPAAAAARYDAGLAGRCAALAAQALHIGEGEQKMFLQGSTARISPDAGGDKSVIEALS